MERTIDRGMITTKQRRVDGHGNGTDYRQRYDYYKTKES